ncbi:MAG: hypothetical protein JRE56_12790 [Deltaproteobacteria bacterium]|jgi:hypothetical protein|nr:hypothetical protein [Deltaproteobacteria bacterium]MBW2511071.1 hypothetical protein [Deltaproteobacteria bacterium]
METKLAEVIVEACLQNGVKAEIKENFSASWMRGRNTTGVVILDGDLAQFLTAIIANAHLFVDGQLPKFSVKERLSLSPFKLSLILY